MIETFNHYIAGSWVPSSNTVENINPSDLSDRIGLYAQATFDQLDMALDAAQNAQKVWANVGSVGQPRDGDPRASFMTWDTTEKKVGYYRVEYDVPTTMNKIRHIPELDNFLADRLENGV